MFEPGDRVVCVDGSDITNGKDFCPSPLVLGAIYTVISVIRKGEVTTLGWGPRLWDAVRLGEVDNPVLPEFGFNCLRFRKLGRADLLDKLLAQPQPQPEDERDIKRTPVAA